MSCHHVFLEEGCTPRATPLGEDLRRLHLVSSRLGPMCLSLSLLVYLAFRCNKPQLWIEAESRELFKQLVEPGGGPGDPDTAESAVPTRTKRWRGLNLVGRKRQNWDRAMAVNRTWHWSEVGASERRPLKNDLSLFLSNSKMVVPRTGGRSDPTIKWWVQFGAFWTTGATGGMQIYLLSLEC